LNGALLPALAHREIAAAERLLERGAALNLTAAVCLGRADDVARLAPASSAGERQDAFAAAALYGNARALAILIGLGVDVNAYNPPGFHDHGTALHHAVDSGSLDAVRVLVEAGADRGEDASTRARRSVGRSILSAWKSPLPPREGKRG
jgi:peptide-methionine (S)-S-oxide reductase